MLSSSGSGTGSGGNPPSSPHSNHNSDRVSKVSGSNSPVVTNSPLVLLTHCCADEDPSTRKFACFAVGNAAFHSGELYSFLFCSIPLLALAAESELDGKSRANAAGAIGNLVRNGGILAREMARVGVPLTLLRSVLIENDLPTQRIALFSLGTMAVYPSCRFVINISTLYLFFCEYAITILAYLFLFFCFVFVSSCFAFSFLALSSSTFSVHSDLFHVLNF